MKFKITIELDLPMAKNWVEVRNLSGKSFTPVTGKGQLELSTMIFRTNVKARPYADKIYGSVDFERDGTVMCATTKGRILGKYKIEEEM